MIGTLKRLNFCTGSGINFLTMAASTYSVISNNPEPTYLYDEARLTPLLRKHPYQRLYQTWNPGLHVWKAPTSRPPVGGSSLSSPRKCGSESSGTSGAGEVDVAGVSSLPSPIHTLLDLVTPGTTPVEANFGDSIITQTGRLDLKGVLDVRAQAVSVVVATGFAGF